ncbi:periplasmic heavy metal sensor [Rhodobacteraceae bacterium M382]|nr:periplasmic heavy metal sensor [Rhodobacteraceae bacterium M382]
MSTEQDKPQKTPMRPWLRVVLIGSLTANLLVVGLVIGAAWRFRDHDGMRPTPSVGAMMYRELSRADRNELRQHAWGDRGKFKQKRLEDGLAVTQVLRQVPFDPDALSELLRAQVHRRETFQAGIQEKWINRVAKMSDGERQDYADRLETRMKKGGHKRH